MKWKLVFIISLCLCFSLNNLEARKIKNKFVIEKVSREPSKASSGIKGELMEVGDSIQLNGCSFSGYEKEATASTESFLLSNPTSKTLTGFIVRIDYLDLQDRMMHSRRLEAPCYVPTGETRKIDVKSWDKQHTFYYYLGNEPRKVATPYKVVFTPLAFYIEN